MSYDNVPEAALAKASAAPVIDVISNTLSESIQTLDEVGSLIYQLDSMLVGDEPRLTTRGPEVAAERPSRPGKLGTCQDQADNILDKARRLHEHAQSLLGKL